MSYNGSGTFVINSTGQPVVTGTVISSTVFNALTADLATGLSTAVCKDGQTTTTARVPFAQGISSTLTTDATSITTGSIVTAGGISTQKALWVGGLGNIAGALTVGGVVTLPVGVNHLSSDGKTRFGFTNNSFTYFLSGIASGTLYDFRDSANLSIVQISAQGIVIPGLAGGGTRGLFVNNSGLITV